MLFPDFFMFPAVVFYYHCQLVALFKILLFY